MLNTKECRSCGQERPLSEFYAQRRNCKTCHCKKINDKRRVELYGVTPQQYSDLVLEQGGKCKICGQLPNSKGLALDHCHTTGKVRGLLCSECNTGLGKFYDNIENLERAILYLRAAEE